MAAISGFVQLLPAIATTFNGHFLRRSFLKTVSTSNRFIPCYTYNNHNNTCLHYSSKATPTDRHPRSAYVEGGKKSAPPQIYLPHVTQFIAQTLIEVPDNEIRHIRALRLRDNDNVTVFNSTGEIADGKLKIVALDDEKNNKNKVKRKSHQKQYVEVIRRTENKKNQVHNIHIVVSMVNSAQRSDTMIEKLTELNVKSISIFKNHNHNNINEITRLQRWHAISVAAAKQSLRSNLPSIQCVSSWDQLIQLISNHPLPLLLCSGGQNLTHHSLIKRIHYSNQAMIIVGGEEGFNQSQIEQLTNNGGALKIGLGALRLRVETAAMTAAGTVGQILDMNSEPVHAPAHEPVHEHEHERV